MRGAICVTRAYQVARASPRAPLRYNVLMRTLVLLLILLCALPAAAQDAIAPPDVIGLVYGEPVSGNLGNALPREMYAFDGLRGEVISVHLDITSGNLDPVLMLLDGSGVPLVLADDSAGQRGISIDSLRIPRSGRYALVVGRFGYGLGTTAGSYELLVERIGVSSASGSALRYGDTVINEINDATPRVYYTFRARRGDIINVSMQRISGNLDTYLQIATSSALVIAENDDIPASGTLDAMINGLVIEEDGLYVIIASRFGQEAGRSSGGFYLVLEEAADSGLGNSIAAALPITEDIPVEGEITAEHFTRYYRFEARANDLVSVSMQRLDGTVDAYLALLNEAGTELVANDDSEGSQNAAIQNFLVPADGVYYIVATRYEREAGQTTGRYRLTFSRVGNASDNLPQDTRFIPYGSTLTGRIDDTTPEVLYAFYGQVGETITVAMTRGDGDLDPVVAILDASQQVLISNDDSDGGQNARIERYTLPATGLYYVRASRFSGEGQPPTRGSYILVLAQVFE